VQVFYTLYIYYVFSVYNDVILSVIKLPTSIVKIYNEYIYMRWFYYLCILLSGYLFCNIVFLIYIEKRKFDQEGNSLRENFNDMDVHLECRTENQICPL
jgi:hypothetical protein